MAGYVNQVKVLRATKQLKDEAKFRGENNFKPTDEQIKARYLQMGGLWLESTEAKTENEPVADIIMRRNRKAKREREIKEEEE